MFRWILLFLSFNLHAQEVVLSSGVIEQQVQAGLPITGYLTARYPATKILLLPDSATKIPTFEIRDLTYFPTVTTNGISYDSVVYTLTTFEVQDTLKLQFQVLELTATDSITIMSTPVAIPYKWTATQLPDSIAMLSTLLIPTAGFKRIPLEVNQQLIIAGAVIGILLLASGWIAFGTQIGQFFKRRRMLRDYRTFENIFANACATFRQQPDELTANKLIIEWRRYLEGLDNKPYTKLTTSELLAAEADFQSVATELRQLDKFRYGGSTVNLPEPEKLFQVVKTRFDKALLYGRR